MPQIQSGNLKGLAVTGAERWPDLPDIPTVAELMHRMGRLRLFRHLEWCWVTAADGASIAAAR